MADVLVVFHSRSGRCRLLAEALGKQRAWSVGEVAYLAGAQSYGHCAADALLRREPEIRYTGPNPARYEVVVLVTPIWCWRLCPPMRSFVRSMHGKLSRVAVLTCMGGSGAANAVREIERLVHRPAVATLALRQAEVDAGFHTDRLRGFADEVAACAATHARAPVATVAQAA